MTSLIGDEHGKNEHPQDTNHNKGIEGFYKMLFAILSISTFSSTIEDVFVK